MSKKEFRCPNCNSIHLTFIVYWKPLKDLKYRTIDLFSCQTCKKAFDMGTREELPNEWQPKIHWPKLSNRDADKVGQVDLGGNVQFIERTINPLPRMLIEQTGETVTQYSISIEHQNDQYREACRKMIKDLYNYKPAWKVPDWYKYKIKRGE